MPTPALTSRETALGYCNIVHLIHDTVVLRGKHPKAKAFVQTKPPVLEHRTALFGLESYLLTEPESEEKLEMCRGVQAVYLDILAKTENYSANAELADCEVRMREMLENVIGKVDGDILNDTPAYSLNPLRHVLKMEMAK
jgi:hypothetical protein